MRRTSDRRGSDPDGATGALEESEHESVRVRFGQVHFGEFRFDLDSLELWRGATPVSLAPKPATVLAVLVARPGVLIRREELYAAAWGDTVVEFDLALNTAIRHVRRALGDAAGAPSFVQTVPRRGYRFIGRVTRVVPVVRPRSGGWWTWGRHRWSGARGPRLAGRSSAAIFVVVAAASALAMAAITSAGIRPWEPAPTVEVDAVRLLDDQQPSATGAVVEATLRNELARAGGRRFSVLAARAGRREEGVRAAYRVSSTLHTAADGDPLLDVQIVRTEDRTIVWSGGFNPHCPVIADPPRFIGRYVAAVLLRRLS